jgi:hypothetical protein
MKATPIHWFQRLGLLFVVYKYEEKYKGYDGYVQVYHPS